MPITTCPTCGSRKICRRKTNVTFPLPDGKKKLIRNLVLELCPDCGEMLFDLEASWKVEEAFGIHYPRRKRKVA